MKGRHPRFSRFRALTPEAVNVELQVHTTRTDGEATVDRLLEAAAARGLGAIAFTEHVRRETAWFPDFAREVRDAAAAHPALDVYVGCEAKALDAEGGFDAGDDLLAQCDVVLGSVHRFPDGEGGFLDFDALSPEATARIECDLAVGLVRHAPIDVLAHPGGMYQRRHGAYPTDLFRRMMEAALEEDVAVEINSSYLVEPGPFLALCEELDPYVSVGSDVHRVGQMAACRDMLIEWFGW